MRIQSFKTGEFAGKTKWHLYIGEPPYDKRCSVTLIKFSTGKQDDPFAIWAYLGANMYLCLGNELPDNGALPDPPEKAMEYLNGKDINGNAQGLSGTTMSNSNSQAQAMMEMVNNSGCEGGLMVGACAEGDFGVNAGLVYAHAYACLGFDVMLKKTTDGQECRGGGQMGWKGWYGMGQAYLVMLGDIGVHIDLWFIKKDVPIIEVGLGALVRAGLPNPTWCYGKARASLKLLGGIFNFDRSIEFKAGKVCLPDYGDPLDNITIVADAQPGNTNMKEGYNEVSSAYSKPRFTTNFVIEKSVRLVDQNDQADAQEKYNISEEKAATLAERTYRFIIKSVKIYNSNGTLYSNCTWDKADEGINFNVNCTYFKPNTKYYMEIVAAAQEYTDKGWGDPIIKGKPTPKIEKTYYYFKTGELGDDIKQNIAYSLPKNGHWSEVRYDDMKMPYLCLNRDRSDLIRDGVGGTINTKSTNQTVQFGYRWVHYVDGKRVGQSDNYVIRNKDYETWRPYNSFPIYVVDSKKQHKIVLVKYALGAKDNTITKETETTVKKSQLVNKNGQYKASSTKPKSGEVNYARQMKNFFDAEERENAKDRVVKTTTNAGYVDQVAIAANEEPIYTIIADEIIWTTFANDSKYYGYEDVYMAVKDIKNTYDNPINVDTWDEYYIKNGKWNVNPYTQMAYYSIYAFPGGQQYNKYAFSNYEMRMRGLDITLSYPTLRAGNSFFNGIMKSSSTFNIGRFQNYWPMKNAEGYGYWLPSWYYNINTDHYKYSNDRYKFDNNNLRFTTLHKEVMSALISDAYTAQYMAEKISSAANWAADAVKRARNNNKKDDNFRAAVKNHNDIVMHSSETTCDLTTLEVKPNDTRFYPTLNVQLGTFSVQYKHYWLLENMAGDPVKSTKTVENIPNFKKNYPYRYGDAKDVWKNIRNASFTAKYYLKQYLYIKYEIWRTERYNFKAGRKETKDTDKNYKVIQVDNPMAPYKFN